jgi:hypothetical protein
MRQTVMKLAEIFALQAAQMTGKHEPNSDETSRNLRPASCTKTVWDRSSSLIITLDKYYAHARYVQIANMCRLIPCRYFMSRFSSRIKFLGCLKFSSKEPMHTHTVLYMSIHIYPIHNENMRSESKRIPQICVC